MLGPADLADWTYDERDLVSGWLRRHDAVHAVVTGRDAAAQAFPPHLRDLACRFARQEQLALEELVSLAQALAVRAA